MRAEGFLVVVVLVAVLAFAVDLAAVFLGAGPFARLSASICTARSKSTLSTSSPALARRLGDDLNKDVLREALNELLGVRWRVDAVVEGAGPAAGARNAAPEEAREAARAAEAAEARELMAERAAETSSDGDREPAPAVDQEQAALQLLRAQLGARPVDS